MAAEQMLIKRRADLTLHAASPEQGGSLWPEASCSGVRQHPLLPSSTQEKLLGFTCASPSPAPSPDTQAPTDSPAIFGTGPCWHKPLPEISNALPITHVEKTNIR